MAQLYLLARQALAESLRQSLLGSSAVPITVSTDLREALARPYRSGDLLIVDDGLLADNAALVEQIARLPCRKALLGAADDLTVARRALQIRSVEIVPPGEVAAQLPKLAAQFLEPDDAAPAPRRLWAMFSSKGGIGKTTLALNFAWAVATYSAHRVALVDFDPLGDVGAMLPRMPSTTLVDVVDSLEAGLGSEAVINSLYQVPDIGLTIVPADSSPERSQRMTAAQVGVVLDLLEAHHAYVVADMATGLSDINLALLDRADEIWVLTAPEKVTLLPLMRSLPILRTLYRDKLVVVVNRSDSETGLETDEIGEMLGQPVVYALPSGGVGPVVAANQGRPLVAMDPSNPLARAIVHIARDQVTRFEGPRRNTPRLWGRSRGTLV
ncbi:MAG: P-loop NTPase [Firmicutes bacterium]|nr:P-loop NTPase [Bacillota bacterium]